MPVELIHVDSGAGLDDVRKLFREYAQSLNFNLCFQNFEKELADLPGDYGLPSGRIVLCRIEGQSAGCIAMRRIETGVCEMKRLYVKPEFRGMKLGKQLADHLVREARDAGYSSMRLDTIAGVMDDAIRLYRAMGFKEIPPYCENPIPDALYMELDLNGRQPGSHL